MPSLGNIPDGAGLASLATVVGKYDLVNSLKIVNFDPLDPELCESIYMGWKKKERKMELEFRKQRNNETRIWVYIYKLMVLRDQRMYALLPFHL